MRLQTWIAKAKDGDKPLAFALLGSALVLLFITATIIYCVHYMYEFKTFKENVQYSMAKVHKAVQIEISYDGEERTLNEADWKAFSNFMRELNAGAKQKEFPGDTTGDVLTMQFKDDTKLEFCYTEITAKTRNRDDGICIRYTRANGSQYIIDTDQYGFETVKHWFE